MKAKILRGVFCIAAAVAAAILHKNGFAIYVYFPIFAAAYLCAGAEVLLYAFRGILHGELFDENFLMLIAGSGAFAIGNYTEAIAVMLFYQVGEQLSEFAVERTRKALFETVKLRPEYANVQVGAQTEKVKPEEVKIGDIIIVYPGELVPLDGEVTDGAASLDVSSVTGESVPVEAFGGENTSCSAVVSGSVNLNGIIKVRVTKNFANSTVGKIIEIVEKAEERKSKTERFITKFAKIYTPIVIAAALFTAFAIPAITGGDFKEWIYKGVCSSRIFCGNRSGGKTRNFSQRRQLPRRARQSKNSRVRQNGDAHCRQVKS